MSTETSVIMSLAQLAQMEEQRVAQEDARRAAARAQAAREAREAEARRRAAEAAQIAADAEARARRVREEAEAKARAEAREKAAADVARIEAEARARLEADNAARAHELALLEVKAQSGARRLGVALVAVIGLSVCGAALGGIGFTRRVAGLTQEIDQLREGQAALAKERESAKAAELGALDRRFTSLSARPRAAEAKDARLLVEAARGAVDPKAPDRDRLRAVGDALDAFEARIAALDKLADLDERRADLAAWAADRKRGDATSAVLAAAARAKAKGAGESEVRAYAASLDRLREALARSAGGGARERVKDEKANESDIGCANPGDPLCGLNGKRL